MRFDRFPIIQVTLLSLLIGLCSSCRNGNNGHSETEMEFYGMSDFGTTKKFDIHIHINTTEEGFIRSAQRNNFRFLDIVDDRPFGLPMKEQEKIAFRHLNAFPGTMWVATTFPVNNWDRPHWVDSTKARLDRSFRKGATAVKIWKNIGMDLRDKDSSFVMVSHPRIDSIISYLEQKNIPLLGHNGEPKDCWLPLEEMTFSQGYYGAHPEYHMYLHPEYPSYEDQINARDEMLRKNPKLNFMGAHMGSLEWSLEELSKRLDRFPNMTVDLTRMPYLKLHAFNDYDKTRNFFIKYQDRLLYGTDSAINPSPTEAGGSDIVDRWKDEWEFFVTDNPIPLEGYGTLKGLHLPKSVVDKIYLENALRFLNIMETK